MTYSTLDNSVRLMNEHSENPSQSELEQPAAKQIDDKSSAPIHIGSVKCAGSKYITLAAVHSCNIRAFSRTRLHARTCSDRSTSTRRASKAYASTLTCDIAQHAADAACGVDISAIAARNVTLLELSVQVSCL